MSRSTLGLLVGLVISALAIWWVLPADNLQSLPGYIASARSSTLLLAVAAATGTFLIRAARWRFLLRAEGGASVSWSAAWHATTIGFMANNILPLRLGEVIRGVAVSRLSPVSVPAALASIAVERVFDALAVVALFAIALASGALPTDIMVGGRSAAELIQFVGAAGIVALILAVVAGLYPDQAERAIRRLVPWPPLAEKLAGFFRAFAHGLKALHEPSRILAVVAGSLLLWSLNAWSFGLAFAAFGLPSGPAVAVLLQTFVVFAVAVPSGPAYVGVIEYAMQLGGRVVGVPDAASLSAAITYHILTFIPITLLGAWSLKETGLKLGELKQQ